MTEPLLDVQFVTKRFEGVCAVDAVSLRVDAGEFVALIGPNGAGKTTLFHCLSGVLRPDGGTLRFRGRNLSHIGSHERSRLGLARTFQRLELFVGLSVRDHLLVADRAHRQRGAWWHHLLAGARVTTAEAERCEATLDLLGLGAEADAPVESLGLGRGRLVEVARALMCDPLLLILDEPTSGLDRDETSHLGSVLTSVRAERGTAILLVEHDVPLVERLAERAYVLDCGRMIAEGTPHDVLSRGDVRAAYLGSAV